MEEINRINHNKNDQSNLCLLQTSYWRLQNYSFGFQESRSTYLNTKWPHYDPQSPSLSKDLRCKIGHAQEILAKENYLSVDQEIREINAHWQGSLW
jgi:hypothetical protein